MVTMVVNRLMYMVCIDECTQYMNTDNVTAMAITITTTIPRTTTTAAVCIYIYNKYIWYIWYLLYRVIINK